MSGALAVGSGDTWATSRGDRARPRGHLATPAPGRTLTSLVGSRESLARTPGTEATSQQRISDGAEPDPAGWTVTQARLRPRRVGVASAGARAAPSGCLYARGVGGLIPG